VNQYILSTILTSLTTFLIGGYVVFNNFKASRNRALCFFALSVSAWSLFLFLNIQAKDIAQAILFVRLLHVSSTLIAISFLHLALILSNNLKQKTFLIACYLIAFFTAFFDFSPWLVSARYLNDFGFIVANPEILYPLHLLVFFGFHIYAFLLIFFELINAKGEKKNEFFYFMLAILIGYSGGAANYLINFNIKIFPFWPFGNYTIVAFVAILAYAITKTRLMDIRVVIGKTFSHLITIAIFAGIYSVMAVLYISTYGQFDWWFFAASVCYGILVGESFDRLRQHIQTPFDRFFIKSTYNFSEITRDMTVKFRKSTTKPSIIENIFPLLDNKVDISSVRFFFADQNDRLVEWDTKELKPIFESTIPSSDPLIVELMKKKEKDVAPIPEGSAVKGALCIPSSHDDKILAAIILGKKRSEDDYTEQDLNLFRAISEYMMVSLEFIIKPFEAVTHQFEASERKLMRAEKELYRSQRLASIGTLTAGVTHEIRNPLGVLRSGLEILPKQLRDQNYLNEFRDKYVKYVDRIEGIVEKVLGLARDERVKTERTIDLNALIQGTVKLVNFKDNTRAVFDLQAIPKIKGVEDDLERVIINLAENADHAMPDGGTLTIKTYTKKVDEQNRVFVELVDTGIGIPEENKEKIFDPFFSSRHEGTGLGLSICFRIIKEHGGDISFQSEEGKGTTFLLSFPPLEV